MVAPKGCVISVEGSEFIFQRYPAGVGPNKPLHHMVEGVTETHPDIANGGRDLSRICIVNFVAHFLLLLYRFSLHVPKLFQHRPNCRHKHHLDPLLHVLGKVREPDGR